MAPLTCYFGGRSSAPPPLLLLLLLLFLWFRRVRGDCVHQHVNNASLRNGDAKDSYPVGTVLHYHCIPGFEPIPGQNLSLTCLPTSKWSTENPTFCQGRRCPTITLENGRIIKSTDLRLGDEITLDCNEGHRLVGHKILQCVLIHDSVDWNRDVPLCQRIPCLPPPDIANGRHSGLPGADYDYGSTVTYTCNNSYTLIGNHTITCLVAADGVNGEWRPAAPVCKVVICHPPVIQNGGITTTYKLEYTYGNRVDFVCNHGYTLVGNDSSVCGDDNNWHPPVPTCVHGTITTTSTILPSVTTETPTILPSITTETPTILPSITTETPTILPSVTTETPTSSTNDSTTVSTTGGGGGGEGGGEEGGGGGDGGGDGGREPEYRPTIKPLPIPLDDSGPVITSAIFIFVLALTIAPCLILAVQKCRSPIQAGKSENSSQDEFDESLSESTLDFKSSTLQPKGSALESRGSPLQPKGSALESIGSALESKGSELHSFGSSTLQVDN